MDLNSFGAARCKEALSSYDAVIRDLGKPNLVSLDDFYRRELPELLRQRNPNPHITAGELSRLMEWKLARGKWRPRLLSFMSALDDAVVREASTKAFASLPDVSKAVQELTVLKGVGPATASAVLAAYAPEVAPFMSDEALIVVTGDTKDYSLKRYVAFAEKMQIKAKELSSSEDLFTPSDVERALWSSTIGAKLKTISTMTDEVQRENKYKRKRKR
ncbi:tryptophan synthase beta chain [Striga asiatica]|uniref:Tryptophan synthase beta chain n=1 Tax=Striga asiatica TaxID=4170 RepID=A0A5A7Q838_STRAF|nr:tryptophan synthase beta chain [Striga asiatica]